MSRFRLEHCGQSRGLEAVHSRRGEGPGAGMGDLPQLPGALCSLQTSARLSPILTMTLEAPAPPSCTQETPP